MILGFAVFIIIAARQEVASAIVFRGPPDGVFPEISHYANGRSWFGEQSPADIFPGGFATFNSEAEPVPGGTHIIHFGDFEYQTAPGSGGVVPISAADVMHGDARVETGSFLFDFDPFNVPGGDSGSFTLVGSTGLTVGAMDSFSSTTGHASLEIRGSGTLTTLRLAVGVEGSTGELVVSGSETSVVMPQFPGFQASTLGFFQVGRETLPTTGNQLRVEQGASIDAFHMFRASMGSIVSINGAGSSISAYAIHLEDDSTLTVSDGGTLVNANNQNRPLLVLGGSALGIQDEGTSVTSNSQLAIRDGSMMLSNGATLQSARSSSPSGSSGIIGEFSGEGLSSGVATVTGLGSRWTQDGGLTAGLNASGELNIENGGYVQSLDGFVGRRSGGLGTVTIEGGGSWDIDRSLYLGGEAAAAGGTGELTVSSGNMKVGEQIALWQQGEIAVEAGGGVKVGVTSAEPASGSLLLGQDGRLSGSGIVSANVENEQGNIAPGNSAGQLTIQGDLALANSSTLEIEIGGLTAGDQFDQLVVSGDVALGGLLQVELINSFELASEQSFEIIDVTGDLTSEFAGLSEGTVVGDFDGGNLHITYQGGDGNDVALYVPGEGDFDFDGDVDGADFLTWQRDPTIGDLANWRANFGNPASLAASTAVPEPRAIALSAIAGLCVSMFLRRV